MTNSIVSGNQWYACELSASGGQVAFTSGGYNVLQDQSCTPAATDQVAANAGLGSLADNGGPTRTIELLTGSAAIDAIPAGTNGCGTTITTDQRGYVRPAGAACDTGAFESGAQRPFTFTGFFSPIRNVPTLNPVKAGSAVSVKFSLNGDQGLDILAVGSPASQQIDCSSRNPQGAVEPTSPSGDSGLTYNATTDTYSYKWKTIKTPWKGTCRQLLVTLNDLTVHTAYFQFNK